MKNNDSLYLECDCGDHNHLFKLTYYEDGGCEPTVVMSVQLNQWHPWYRRLWLALRYVCGYESDYGHWDCTSLEPETMRKLRNWCEDTCDEMTLWAKVKAGADKRRAS